MMAKRNYKNKKRQNRLSVDDLKNMPDEAFEELAERLVKTKFYQSTRFKAEESESKFDDKSNEKKNESDGAQNNDSDANDMKDKQTSAETQSDEQSGEQQQKKNKKNKSAKQQKQQKFKVVDRNDNSSPFSASGEFTEEQLVKMYRQMQADRARAQQLFNHVTSPYTMRGATGETLAMAAGAFMGFALGRSMYKVSRIGHLRQDWRLRREVLRQERGYYNQGTQNRFGGILGGFSNAASSFVQGWRRGRRTDINMDVQQPSEKVEVKAPEETAENEPTAECEAG